MKLKFLIMNAVFTLMLTVISIRLGWIVWNSGIEAADRFAINIILGAFIVNEFAELFEKRTNYYRQRIEEELEIGRTMRGN